MLSEHYFGDVDGLEEERNHPDYFRSTFVTPSSFNQGTLANNKKYIVLGRKGTGKTAVQVQVARKLEDKGYITKFFSFHDGVKLNDFNDAVRTQKLDLIDISTPRNIFSSYDFRDIWERTFLVKIAEALKENHLESKFTKFMLGERSRLSSLFEGVIKTATIKISADMGAIAGEVGFDLSKYDSSNGIPIYEIVNIAKDLFKKYHRDHLVALFVDELVFSRLDARDDEIRLRAAMVRDILKVARGMNGEFVQMSNESVVFCTLRPEVRDLLCDLDAEISKSIDGKFVELIWDTEDDDDSLLMRVLKQKIIHSRLGRQINVDGFLTSTITFGSRTEKLSKFLLTNTWARPRDIVHLLDSVQTRNPNAYSIGETEIKAALNEFSRRLIGDVSDEISVKHGIKIIQALRGNLRGARYKNFDEFYSVVFSNVRDLDKRALADDLYIYGVIGNIQDSPRRYYWFHRGEEFLNEKLPIFVHPGLWNYFNIR